MKRFTLNLEEEIHYSLKLMSLKENTTMQDLINKAIQDFYGNKIDEMRLMGELSTLDRNKNRE